MRGKVEKEMLKASLVAITLVVDEMTPYLVDDDSTRMLVLRVGVSAHKALKKVEDDRGEPPS